jgi:hypothetical protein
VPAASANKRVEQLVSEWLQGDCVQANQADVAKRGSKLPSKIEFSGLERRGPRRHRLTHIQHQANGHSGLNLEHLQEQLLQSQECAPVYRSEVVALMKNSVIEKFLTRAREMRYSVSAYKTCERFVPVKSEPLQPFEKTAIKKRFTHS